MKIFVTGVSGQLGHDVMNELDRRGIEAVGSDIAPAYSGVKDDSPVTRMPYVQLDITDEAAVKDCIGSLKPDAVIHCAAWTAVDAAEDEENIPKVGKINADGTRYIAQACAALGAKMMYISTDYVFDGQGTDPWEPDCKDYAPLNVYGQSKLDGELAVSGTLDRFFIVRIAWVFGRSGKNFIRTMLRLGQTHDQLRIVSDQIGTPTYTADLAILLCDMIVTDRYGCYHATNAEVSGADAAAGGPGKAADAAGGPANTGAAVGDPGKTGDDAGGPKTGYISWYDFTCEIFRQAAALGHPEYLPENTKLTPVTTEEYGISKARRPFNSRLDKSKLTENGFHALPEWPDALHRYLLELSFEDL